MVSLPETLLLLAAVFYILASVFTALGLRRASVEQPQAIAIGST
jgi:hypothetical protein